MTRPRYCYEPGDFYRDGLDILDTNGDETGDTGYVSVPGFDIIDELLGRGRPIAFTEDRDAAAIIVAALNHLSGAP